MGPLNFLSGGYQRADASSTSQFDARCSNETANESFKEVEVSARCNGTAEFKSAGHVEGPCESII